jgi:hypothetical protein
MAVQPMGHTFPVMRAVGAAAVMVALVWTSGALSSTPPKPHLRLLERAPLTVNGTHFRGRERVRIKIVTSELQTRSVRTARDGSFTTRFDTTSIGRCGGLAIQATGARGDQATLKVREAQDCAPGLGP